MLYIDGFTDFFIMYNNFPVSAESRKKQNIHTYIHIYSCCAVDRCYTRSDILYTIEIFAFVMSFC